MASKATELNDNTKFAMPVRNLISLIVTVAVGVWAYFGIIERLNKLETNETLMKADLVKNTEFRIKWPRGELGELPADKEQFMLIEHLSKEFAKLVGMVEEGKAPFDQQQALILDFYRQRIETIEQTIEKLKESQLAIKNGTHK
jgi:hypothetical protein|tara:strand:- start:463 stop:894 length:432 start_codon:yes stop_codon:yes gene_type:complete